MLVKLTFIDTFDSDFNNQHYKIYQFANPVTFELLNGVNLDTSIKLIPYEVYKCTITRNGRKWRVTKIEN